MKNESTVLLMEQLGSNLIKAARMARECDGDDMLLQTLDQALAEFAKLQIKVLKLVDQP
jgi:hypothetical protein